MNAYETILQIQNDNIELFPYLIYDKNNTKLVNFGYPINYCNDRICSDNVHTTFGEVVLKLFETIKKNYNKDGILFIVIDSVTIDHDDNTGFIINTKCATMKNNSPLFDYFYKTNSLKLNNITYKLKNRKINENIFFNISNYMSDKDITSIQILNNEYQVERRYKVSTNIIDLWNFNTKETILADIYNIFKYNNLFYMDYGHVIIN